MTWLPDDFSPDSKDAEVDRLREKLKIATAALEAADKMLLACAGLAGHYGHADAATEGKAAADAVRAALAKVRP